MSLVKYNGGGKVSKAVKMALAGAAQNPNILNRFARMAFDQARKNFTLSPEQPISADDAMRRFMISNARGNNNGRKSMAVVGRGEQQVTRRARVRNVNQGRTQRIVNREFICSITSASGVPSSFDVTKIAVNPGLSETFPWLSTQASGWEQYKLMKLNFVFVPRVPTSEAGSLIMAPDYDPMDPAPTTEAQLTSMRGAIETVVWQGCSCSLDVSSMFSVGNRKYVREGAVAGTTKLFDACNLFVGTIGCTASTSLGKLWVEYEVEFFVPRTSVSTCANMASGFYGTGQGVATGVPETPNWTVINDPLEIVNCLNGTVAWPKGCYEIYGTIVGDDTANEAVTLNIDMYNVTLAGIITGQYTEGQFEAMATPRRPVPFLFHITGDGTSLLQMRVTMTGAAGTLSLEPGYSHCGVRVM